MEIHFLKDIVIILGLSVLVIFLFERLKLPTILGFLLTGIIAGPYGFGFVNASHEVEIMSEIGVILLLFIIGLEFSLSSLYAIRRLVFVGGSVQVFGTIGLTLLVMTLLGFSWQKGVFMGFLFSLSSTAIVLKILQEKSEINSKHGKLSLGILIFQDIIVVPMMLFTPLIAGNSDNVLLSLLDLVIKALLVMLGVYVSARYVYPRLMYEVARTRNNELFILTVVVTCALVAWITSAIGLSLALGAFLAGLIISESEYSHQATSIIIPFREIFASFFFVSIGMLLDISFLGEHFLVSIGLVLVVMFFKGFIAALAAWVLKLSLRTCLMSGLALFQVGEFAFILSRSGIENNLLDNEIYQYFLSVSILSMAITPFVLIYSDKIIKLLLKTPIPRHMSLFTRDTSHSQESSLDEETVKDLEDHLIVIGYGSTGRNLVQAAKHAHIPYFIIEYNAETVKEEAKKGEPIIFGDASQDIILEHVRIHNARVAVVAISNPEAAKLVVQNIRTICRTVYIVARVRYVSEVQEYITLGANEVISEEFESSIEIFTNVLHKYLLPEDEIEYFVDKIRSEQSEFLRPLKTLNQVYNGLEIPNLRISCLNVQKSYKEIVGKTISKAAVRQKYGINILAIQREEELITDIQSDTQILLNDLLYVLGAPEQISKLNTKIKA
jgi:CPA2 family monovalent cation:H+ antiporter-2